MISNKINKRIPVSKKVNVSKDSFNEYKNEKKDSDDPIAKEKISAAREINKVVEKQIEEDYQQTVNEIENDASKRIESINKMLQDDED